VRLGGFAGPGHWNDLDMLVTGVPRFGWTLSQEQSQLSVWAEESSPLLISADISALTPGELSALKNPQLIAIDQSGAQAARVSISGHIEALAKPDPGGGSAVLLANFGTRTSTGHFTLSQFHITTPGASSYNVWTCATGTLGALSVTLPAGRTELLILKAQA
jgi:alpha-galactosidase